MKSAKQKRQEITAKREKYAKKKADNVATTKIATPLTRRPINSVLANVEALAHNNTYGPLPLLYVDKAFVCRDCGKQEVWTATQQKWWYEVAKGHIDSFAVRCRACRHKERQRKAKERLVYLQGIAKKKYVQS